MIVNGFIEPVTKELPMEYAVELNRLIQLEMVDSIGYLRGSGTGARSGPSSTPRRARASPPAGCAGQASRLDTARARDRLGGPAAGARFPVRGSSAGEGRGFASTVGVSGPRRSCSGSCIRTTSQSPSRLRRATKR